MGLKRVLRAWLAVEQPQQAAEAEPTAPAGAELDLEQRLERVEIEVGDLWESLRRMSARQAARARRDVEQLEAANGDAAVGQTAVQPSAAPVGLRVGSREWRAYQKSLIRGGEAS